VNFQDFISAIPLQAGLFILLGLAIMAITFLSTSAYKKLSRSGIPAEGIIFKLEIDGITSGSSDYSGNSNDRVIVRFLTSEKVWVTAEAKHQFLISYTGQYKEGDKVMVKYDPEQPEVFVIETRQSENTARIVFAIIGIVLLIVGIFQCFNH
jgi:hypothetical protein